MKPNEKRIMVAQCGRDNDLNVLEEGKHLAAAHWRENQPEGPGWFIPDLCPECEAEFLKRLEDPVEKAKIDAYICSPEFVALTEKLVDCAEGHEAYRRVMQQPDD
ncbi:MAG: hypothetical protein MPJ50_12040 [Pirellulales bacterium]|nr:hypothetical protein [Pirellulales bacterium]